MGVRLTGIEEAVDRYERLKKAVGNIGPHLHEATPAVIGILKPRYGDHGLKVQSNRLRGSISAFQSNFRFNKKSITYGSGVVYAAIHQFGGRHIPARPWLNFPDSGKETVAKIALASIEKAVQ